ncbi:protein yellow-like [Cloeon dipterum]|uniref:protein yellow-like n=1 Tax=Cloeon dipterum TaxID=197152 RepID=UPI00321F804E
MNRAAVALVVLCAVVSASARLQELFTWNQVDFAWPSKAARDAAIQTGAFVPENQMPLGIEVWKDRLFVTLPRWRRGSPATLATISLNGPQHNQPLQPYPDWAMNREGGPCDGLTGIFRVQIDHACGRLWVLDAGEVDVAEGGVQQCPPKLLAFDLNTDQVVIRHVLPEENVRQGSLFSNLAVDTRNGQCDDTHVYMADAWRFGIVTYSTKSNSSWRVEHNYMQSDPLACRYNTSGVDFRWHDGVFGFGLAPVVNNDRTLYFTPMSGTRAFAVPTSALRNETVIDESTFTVLPQRGGGVDAQWHAGATAMSSNGIMFYNLVTRDAVACWNSRLPYLPNLQGEVARDTVTLNFPNDVKVDEFNNVWVLSNRLPRYLFSSLDLSDVNIRVFAAHESNAIAGTPCDPHYAPQSNDFVTAPCVY